MNAMQISIVAECPQCNHRFWTQSCCGELSGCLDKMDVQIQNNCIVAECPQCNHRFWTQSCCGELSGCLDQVKCEGDTMNAAQYNISGYRCPVRGCPKRNNRLFSEIGLAMHIIAVHGRGELARRLRSSYQRRESGVQDKVPGCEFNSRPA